MTRESQPAALLNQAAEPSPHLDPTLELFMRRFQRPVAQTTGRLALDVGCGDGHNSLYLARGRYVVTGIDNSEMSLAVARRNRGTSKTAVCQYLNVDARDMTSLNDSFSLITANNILPALAKDEQYGVLRNIQARTKRLGRNIVSGYIMYDEAGELPAERMPTTGELKNFYLNAGWYITYAPKPIPIKVLGQSVGQEVRLIASTPPGHKPSE